jgi:formylglycine-generating enzyme required for sulfatase activity
MSDHRCCAPSAHRGDRADHRPAAVAVHAKRPPTGAMIGLDAATFLMGSDDALGDREDHERPVREVALAPFRIDACAVCNAAFAAFAAETGYITEAERFGSSFVFGGLLPDDFPPTHGVAAAPWWRLVERADWAHPEGPRSDVGDRHAHPVVHVSHTDSEAYCAWAGKRLPTEAEWEYAARGGLAGQPFPWGAELEPGGAHRMNVFQGRFPSHNTGADGWYGTCPVDAFPANAYGLRNTTGNVWEWCAEDAGGALPDLRPTRGGSYLCHASYCRRYRVSGRQCLPPDSSTGNIGFRCARDA